MNRWSAIILLLLCSPAALSVTTCRFGTWIPGFGFGPYDVVSAAPTDSQLRVDVDCTRDGGPQTVTVTLGISQGQHGTSIANRRMRNAAGDYMAYGLYLDAGRSANWGITNGVDTGTVSLSVRNNASAPATFFVFGRIPPLQNVSPGTYTDTIQLVVNP